MIRKQSILALICVLTIVLSGCATTESSQFYLLRPLTTETVALQANGETAPSLLIGPITVSKYLNRPQIVTRNSNNTLKFAEFHRWAEHLDDNIAEVMAENLSTLLGIDNIVLFPLKRRQKIDYQLVMDVLQFDRDLDGAARLLMRWSISNGKGQTLSQWKRSKVIVAPNGDDYEALVKAMSTTLADVSREIAGAIFVLVE